MKSLDLAPHELKCLIRIRIDANEDLHLCLVDPPYCCRLHCLKMVRISV
jgi:hypothetical protein